MVYHFAPCCLYLRLPKRPSSLVGVARDVRTNHHILHFGHPKLRNCWKQICTDTKLYILTIRLRHKNAIFVALNVWFVKMKKDAAWQCEAADHRTYIMDIRFTSLESKASKTLGSTLWLIPIKRMVLQSIAGSAMGLNIPRSHLSMELGKSHVDIRWYALFIGLLCLMAELQETLNPFGKRSYW